MLARRRLGTSICLVMFVFTSLSLAYSADDITLKGLIVGRAADTITLQSGQGTQQITLTDSTKVQSPKGLGLRKQQMSWAELIPGLRVNVKATQGMDGNLTAKSISFSNDDLRAANAIQAGLAPTEQKVAANQENIAANKKAITTNQTNIAANRQQIETNAQEVSQRFSDLADYDVAHRTTVFFPTGKSKLGPTEKQALSELTSSASKLTGYIIEVKGFADSSGNPSANQTLSRDRASAVVDYLMQECHIPPRHIVAPGAMGVSNPTASNETSQGRSQNRRVEVSVLTNKGITAAGK